MTRRYIRRGGQPLDGRRVILTRSRDDNRILAQRLQDLGAEVYQVPLNQVRSAPDGGLALGDAVADLEHYRWVVFTSANGVRTVVNTRGAKPWPDSVFVAVVGQATADVAETAGVPVHFIPSSSTAESLVEEFPTAINPEGQDPPWVLAPLAELASSTVEDGLEKKGYLVDRVVAYATVAPTVDLAVEPAIRATVRSADAVVLAAPSAASRYVDRFSSTVDGRQVHPGAAVVCIGPSTAKRASALGLTVAAVANPHDDDGLYDALLWVLVDSVG